jgi:hypothetical protein
MFSPNVNKNTGKNLNFKMLYEINKAVSIIIIENYSK